MYTDLDYFLARFNNDILTKTIVKILPSFQKWLTFASTAHALSTRPPTWPPVLHWLLSVEDIYSPFVFHYTKICIYFFAQGKCLHLYLLNMGLIPKSSRYCWVITSKVTSLHFISNFVITNVMKQVTNLSFWLFIHKFRIFERSCCIKRNKEVHKQTEI